MVSKKSLAVELSKVKGYSSPKLALEQYETESELAGSVLWHAHLHGDINDKTVCDLGAGTGILGIGAIIMDARKVFFVEKEHDALEILKNNLNEYIDSLYEIIDKDVVECNLKCDTVIMNPPFGAQNKGADRPFLEYAFSNSNVIYAILPSVSEQFYHSYAKEHGWYMNVLETTGFRMKKVFEHHNKPQSKISVIIAQFKKIQS